MNQPVFITGVERSGSTLIGKVLDVCGVFKGSTTVMLENTDLKNLTSDFIKQNTLYNSEEIPLMPNTKSLSIPINWKDQVESILWLNEYPGGQWMFKCSLLAQIWPVWHYAYPNARWIIVRRKTGDIIQSCVKTGYMKMFKEEANLRRINVATEEEGWKWWIHQYEKKFVEMIEAGVNCTQVWPERMVGGDYGQIYQTLDWLGLKWDNKIVLTIDPLLTKSRRKENGMRHSNGG